MKLKMQEASLSSFSFNPIDNPGGIAEMSRGNLSFMRISLFFNNR